MSRWIKSLLTVAVMGVPGWVIVLGVVGGQQGSLVIRVAGPGVTVWVDDREVTSTSPMVGPVDVAAGEHRVRVIVRGFPVYDRRVTVDAGGPTLVETRVIPREDSRAGDPAPGHEASAGPTASGPLVGQALAARSFETEGTAVTAVAAADGGRAFVTVGADGSIASWDAATGRRLWSTPAHKGRVRTLAVLDDERRALTLGDDLVLRVWDIGAGQPLESVATGLVRAPAAYQYPSPFLATASADGGTVALARRDGVVRVIDVHTGFEKRRRTLEDAVPGALALSADGRLLLIGTVSGEGEVRPVLVWDVETGKDLPSFRGHRAPVWCVTLLPDGRRALSGGGDQTLRLWDVATGRELRKYAGTSGSLSSLALSPDGRYALVGNGYCWTDVGDRPPSFGAEMWDLERGVSLGRITTRGPVLGVALSAGGRIAVAEANDSALHSWQLPPLPGRSVRPVLTRTDSMATGTPAS